MQNSGMMLAQMSEETTKQIGEMYKVLEEVPSWGLKAVVMLSIFTAVGVIVLWQRQKQIAKNQVDVAKLLEQLIEKK
ncbi:MAG: hypothetical protein JXD22_02775 [Sedimentisphaerales bacterium]|nr:hypothetical protein [Sedimentisphaerales bacterium]